MGSISDGNGGCIDGGSVGPGNNVDEPEPLADPSCETLKNLAKPGETDADITPVVKELESKTALDKEYSISYRKDFNFGEEYSNPDPRGIQEGESLNESPAITSGFWYGTIHTHPVGTYGMFSWTDVNLLKDTYEDLSQDEHRLDAFIMIVNPNGSLYSLKVSDISIMKEQIDSLLEFIPGNNETDKINFFNRQLQLAYSKNPNGLEETFLDRFGFHGFQLYKSNVDNPSNWSKLNLSIDIFGTRIVEETECSL